MAVHNLTGYLTLMDVAKRLDPDGKIARIAEVLATESPVLQDMPWVEANGKDGHLMTVRSSLPSLTWRRYNQGITSAKSTTAQFTETAGMLDGLSSVDAALYARAGGESYRASEDMAFVQSYSRTLESSLWYASQRTNAEQITGFTPRLDALTGIPFSGQVAAFDAAASGSNNASMWLVGWGEKTVFGFYPEGTKAGLDMENYGKRMVPAAGGGEFPAYQSYFTWKLGLAVEDARYITRLCNIDADNTATTFATADKLLDAMTDMIYRIKSTNGVRPVFYAPRTMCAWFAKMARKGASTTLTIEKISENLSITKFNGIPIKQSDGLLDFGEATVA